MMRTLGIVGTLGFGWLLGSGCTNAGPGGGGPKTEVMLRFSAQVGDEEVACDQMFDGLGSASSTAEIFDLRFYISNVRLIDQDGREVDLDLDQDGVWQVQDVALLDFENATGGCGDTGTEEINTMITGSIPEGTYTGVAFDIGVPFNLNHDNAVAAPSPLNLSSMFWGWAVGYKFVRIDLETDTGVPWSFHLGSTGCESDGPESPPVSQCSSPNRTTIVLGGIDPAVDTIVFDLGELFADTDITQDTPESGAGCQSFPDDAAECTSLFPNLGLDFATGECTGDCSSQSCFRVESGVDRGQKAFTTARLTEGGQTLACANCHGDMGTGNIGPDIRGASADHMFLHAHDGGPHPAGVKFTDLTINHCMDIAAFLNSICREDPECVVEVGDGHEHHH